MDPADRRIICKVCLRQYARYTCPRCNTGYCSLPCYKQHGESCTESFYKDQAEGELRAVRAGDDQRRAMMDILRRVQQQQEEEEQLQQQLLQQIGDLAVGAREEEDDEDREEDWEASEDEDEGEDEEQEQEEEEGAVSEDGEEGLDVRGGDVNAGEGRRGKGRGRGGGSTSGSAWGPLADLLSKESRERLLQKAAASGDSEEWEVEEADLTPEEWLAFQRAVALGQLGGGGAVAPWRPWWTLPEARELNLTDTGQRRVVPLVEAEAADRGGEDSSGGGGLPPPPAEPLPPLAALTRAAPSPLLTWHLVEVLYSYCYVMRQFNGDWVYDAGAAAAALLSLTDVLAAGPTSLRKPQPQRKPQSGRNRGTTAGAEGRGEGSSEEDGRCEPAARLPRTAAEACLHGVERACAPPLGSSRDRSYAVAVLYDVVTLLDNGRPSVLLALEDARQLLRAAAAGTDATATSSTAPPATHGSADRAPTDLPADTAAAAADAAPAGSRSAARNVNSDRGGGKRLAGGGGTSAAEAAEAVIPLAKAERVRLAAAERKLWFFLVWSNQLSGEQYGRLAEETTAEWQVLHSTVVAAVATAGPSGAGAGVAPAGPSIRVR